MIPSSDRNERRRQQYRANPDATLNYNSQQRAKARQAVFDHYGHACACCGSADRLTIDHINGDGRQHREDLFGRNQCGSMVMYLWLIRNGFPDGFQALCLPCNTSKGDGAQCGLHRDGSDEQCPAGHLYQDNAGLRGGKRYCKACHRDHQRAYLARQTVSG